MRTEFHIAGMGCFVQLIGLLAFCAWAYFAKYFAFTHGWVASILWVALGLTGLLGFVIIGRGMAWHYTCARCNTEVKREMTLCPNCQSNLVGKVIDDTGIMLARALLIGLLFCLWIFLWRLRSGDFAGYLNQ